MGAKDHTKATEKKDKWGKGTRFGARDRGSKERESKGTGASEGGGGGSLKGRVGEKASGKEMGPL